MFLHFTVQFDNLTAQCRSFLLVCLGFQFLYTFVLTACNPFVFRVALPHLTSVELRDIFHNIFIQLVKVDVRQYGADYSTLRSSAECFVEFPFLQVTCIEKFTDKTQEAFICDAL